MSLTAPLKLYVGEHYREPELISHVSLLNPFWGVAVKKSSPFVRNAMLQYQTSKDDFTLVSQISDADYVVMPYLYEPFRKVNPERVAMIIREAHEAGKPLLIHGTGDLEYPIHVPNSVILRISQYQYSKQPNEITVPFPCEDLLESYVGGKLRLREKTDKPSVAFMGWGRLSLRKRLGTFIKELPITLAVLLDAKRGAEHKGVFFRERALRSLAKSPFVDPRLTTRATYSGNQATVSGNQNEFRRAFVENLLGADYALCVKGDANSSVRFYEALSLGRIPLFLDTACVLPLENKINYRDFCVFVDWKDTDRIAEKLIEFHTALPPEHFMEMQRKARTVYKEHLRTDAFSRELAALLRERT